MQGQIKSRNCLVATMVPLLAIALCWALKINMNKALLAIRLFIASFLVIPVFTLVDNGYLLANTSGSIHKRIREVANALENIALSVQQGVIIGPSFQEQNGVLYNPQTSFSAVDSVYFNFVAYFGVIPGICFAIFIFWALGSAIKRENLMAFFCLSWIGIFFCFDIQGITFSNIPFFLMFAYGVRPFLNSPH